MPRPRERAGKPGEIEMTTNNRLRELLDEDVPAPVAGNHLPGNGAVDAIERPPPRTGLSSPLPLRAVRGKAVPFRDSRTFFAAILITVIAIVGLAFGRWYVSTVITLQNSAEIAAAERAEKFKNAGKAREDRNKSVSVQPARSPSSSSPTPASILTPGRKVAPYTDQIGDWGVSVTAAEIEVDKSTGSERLKLTLRIANYSGRPASYPNWFQSDGDSRVVLRDHYGNAYNQIDATSRGPASVAPGKSTNDYLLFEALSLSAELDLDLAVAGSDRSFAFRIPSLFVRRALAAALPFKGQTPAPSSEATPPPPVPYDPEEDQKLCLEIMDKYREGVATMKQRAMGMSPNHATKFRQAEPEKIRKALMKKYSLDEAQIRRIILRWQ